MKPPIWNAHDLFVGFFHYSWWWVWLVSGLVIFVLRQWHISVRLRKQRADLKAWKERHRDDHYYAVTGRYQTPPSELTQEIGSGWLTFLWCVNLFAFICAGFVYQTDYYDNWMNTKAYPYINQLPVEKYVIKYIKPEILTMETGGKSSYSYTEEKVLVYYQKDDGQIVESDLNADINMSLAPGDTPYIQYQSLNQNLSGLIQSGMWNIHIYLPKDYQFDTMK